MLIQISARGGGGNKTERKPACEYDLHVQYIYCLGYEINNIQGNVSGL